MTARVFGHFGEWLQGRMGPDGPVALVTLTCNALWMQAEAGGHPPEEAAQLGQVLGLKITQGVTGIIPLGCGAGASTASLIAMARGAGFAGDPLTLAKACLSVEGATDPLMFDAPDALLWASRQGQILEHFAPPPACVIVGGYWGAPTRTDAQDIDFPDISDFIPTWQQAVSRGDLPAVARLSSLSAARCTALRGPGDPMADLARDLGALGHIRAHTGSARGLVFPPQGAPAYAINALTEAGLKHVFTFETGAL
ncbi:hypothetical protein [Tropicibacter naphthalenivorans]|uniref:Uncharacterized protein n=1 Tax=Tropicibacter naphthalenivorans TaxID=441103 RepID=A0A0P1GGD0_9RHOB|nr:hypothetical protein [Tropicibacter naphthalenivorans]CUH80846.1 hypothetical protein TRN7648_03195 [Tropicibacter naphthalenivorans]SMC90549.1 threonine kinase [Tropicibacter naphthalenivorans]